MSDNSESDDYSGCNSDSLRAEIHTKYLRPEENPVREQLSPAKPVVSRRDFIIPKINNMIKFVQGVTDVNGEEIHGKDNMINTLQSYINDIEGFAETIIVKIVPHKNNLDNLVNAYLTQLEINPDCLKPEDRDRVKKYMKLFIWFVS